MEQRQSVDSELVEHVRVIFAAVNRQDWDTVMGFYAADSVLDTTPAGMEIFEGVPAIRGFWEGFVRLFAGSTYALEHAEDLGGGVVMAVFTVAGPAPGSAAPMMERYVYVYEWIDGYVRRLTGFADIDEARAFAERRAARAG